ncbi:MAG: universal stress protein [Longimicrobiales bacterium]
MKVLFPTDGSDCSLNALDKFISLVPQLGGTPDVTLLYVHPQLPYPRAVTLAADPAVVARYYEEESETVLAESKKRMEHSGIAFKVVKRVGDPAHEITDFAKTEQRSM